MRAIEAAFCHEPHPFSGYRRGPTDDRGETNSGETTNQILGCFRPCALTAAGHATKPKSCSRRIVCSTSAATRFSISSLRKYYYGRVLAKVALPRLLEDLQRVSLSSTKVSRRRSCRRQSRAPPP